MILAALERPDSEPRKQRIPIYAITVATGILSLICLSFFVLRSPPQLVYDEPYHIGAVKMVHANGWLRALRESGSASATGPLFTAVQTLAEPMTRLDAPWVRVPNLVLTFVLLFTMSCIGHQLRLRHPEALALLFLGVPFVWASCGLALTEMPALVCFTAGISLCLTLTAHPERNLSVTNLFVALAAGALLGTATLGRQTYLVAVVGLPALATRRISTWIAPTVVFVFPAAAACFFYYLWGGLVPPNLAHVDAGPKVWHGVLAFAYIGMATLFIAPRWLAQSDSGNIRGTLPLWLFGIAFLIGAIFPVSELLPGRSLFQRMVPSSILPLCMRGTSAILLGVAVLWLARFALYVWRCRNQRSTLFICIVFLAVAMTPAAISHQFSSRYVVGVISLLVFIVNPALRVHSLMVPIRLAAGATLGAALLTIYYSQPDLSP